MTELNKIRIDFENKMNSLENLPPGQIRSIKGGMVEKLAEDIVYLVWKDIGGNKKRIEINSKRRKIPINTKYVESIKDKKVKDFITSNKKEYFYGVNVDKFIYIDKRLVMGIECKAYTENAMLKRILVDFNFLKIKYPNLDCYLFQLENFLGGDFGQIFTDTVFGSKSTHSILSYFPHIDLNIITMLEGNRSIEQPIHEKKFHKPLKIESLQKTCLNFKSKLSKYL